MLYIRVQQQASIELQELTFSHLHKLSLNWHLSKKTGNIVRVLDRGKEAAKALITYLFLNLVPALAECAAVIILFFVQFSQWKIGILIFGAVFLYCYSTITITQYRAKMREKTNTQDNDFHYKSTDSILNYETVKYFTNEEFEVKRFKDAVVKYQRYNASVQFSLSFLNITQQIILIGALLGTALISGQAVLDGELSIGAWVALQAWVGNIFIPLGFLGTIYGNIIQALVDVTNLSELLFESPDIADSPTAVPMVLATAATAAVVSATVDKSHPGDIESGSTLVTSAAHTGGGVSVEFKNIFFHYPSQEDDKGLRDVSFRVNAGTTTAIVGATGRAQ
jgi:ATP-binding cassette, subfamily B, heavy metal transporter